MVRSVTPSTSAVSASVRPPKNGRLTPRQLVDMVTSVPAHVAAIDDEVGALKEGLRTDVLVLTGDHNDPYAAVVDANPADVQLVLIGGVALYGSRGLMQSFWASADLQPIDPPAASKVLATQALMLWSPI
jgi:cytosine/adenosine deaminase-related metal-dependent hydrolase